MPKFRGDGNAVCVADDTDVSFRESGENPGQMIQGRLAFRKDMHLGKPEQDPVDKAHLQLFAILFDGGFLRIELLFEAHYQRLVGFSHGLLLGFERCLPRCGLGKVLADSLVFF